jgi:hypothetical protein
MVDPPRELVLTVSRSLEGQRGARVPVSIDSSHSSPQVPAPFRHDALSFPSELSQTRPPRSHRRLPIPPVHLARSPSASTSSTSSSSLSLPTQFPTGRRQSVFVLEEFAIALTVIPSVVPTDHFPKSQNPLQSFLSLGKVVQVLMDGRHQ